MESPIAAETQTAEQTTPAEQAVETSLPAPPAKNMTEMNREERTEFLKTGKVSAKKSDGKAADSSTAPAQDKKAAESAASTSEAASEPADPAKDKKARNSEENRVNELLEDRKRERERADLVARENAELRERLKALESGSKPKADAKADSSTAADPSEPEWKKYRTMPGAPKIGDFEDPDDWGAAMAVFVGKQLAKEMVESTLSEREAKYGEQAEIHQKMAQAVDVAATRLEADEKAHPELKEKVHPTFRNLMPLRLLPDGVQPNADHFMKDCITFESDHPLQLGAFYSTDEGWAEWQAMRQMDRRGIERTIARRDLSFGQSSQASTEADKKTAPKTFTKAPAPPDKTGPKSATTADGAEQAVRAGDFTGFQREMDEREPETARRWGRRRL